MATLKEVRTEQGLSQESLALLCQTTHTTISLIETGKVFASASTRARISSILRDVDFIATRCESIKIGKNRPEIVGHLMHFILAPNGQTRNSKVRYVKKVCDELLKTEGDAINHS